MKNRRKRPRPKDGALFAPAEITAVLDRIDEAAHRQARVQRESEEDECRRVQAIAESRDARRPELARCAEAVFAWRDAFCASDVSRRIWDAVGRSARLQLFVARFWKGEPVPETDVTVCAALSLGEWNREYDGRPPFWYEERFKGHASLQVRVLTPQGLVEAVHPDFLAGAAGHLAGPGAWRFVRQQLERQVSR